MISFIDGGYSPKSDIYIKHNSNTKIYYVVKKLNSEKLKRTHRNCAKKSGIMNELTNKWCGTQCTIRFLLKLECTEGNTKVYTLYKSVRISLLFVQKSIN